MPERIFCVDFGSAFTKVALRTAAQEDGKLIPCSDEGLELWAPTVVAADWTRSSTEPRLEFGYRAAAIKPGGKIVVYSNFKKDLFADTAVADGPTTHPLDALLSSEEFTALADKFNVPAAWVHGLRTMAGAAKAMFGADARGVPTEAKRQEDARRLAYHYFKWLRERVLEACARLPHTALKYEDIPLRIAVPVLGAGADLNSHPGCRRLRDALAATGWRLDTQLFVSEPESNVIGILSNATNRLKKGKINLGEMLGKGPLNSVLAGDEHFPTYRAILLDVGAFTTDFAALTVDTGGTKAGADTSFGAGFRVVQQSIPFGISNLDESVRAVFSDERRAALDGLSRKDFATFQNSAYAEGKGYKKAGLGVLGGEDEQLGIQAALTEFARSLVSHATTFCQLLPGATRQELILTGGGSNIPVVRDALLKATEAVSGNPFVKVHAPGLKKAKFATPVDALDDKFARGASALGGASIYFEKSYY